MILTDIRIKQSPLWQTRTHFTGDIDQIVIEIYHKLPRKIQNHLRPFLDTVIMLRKMWGYEAIVTANVKTGQLVAFFRRMFGVNRPKHIILELMLDEESPTRTWKIKRTLQRFLFSSVDVIFVSSSEEVKTYSRRFNLPQNRFKFIHFHTNIIHPKMYFCPDSYILSAGRTGRDFHSLVEAAKNLEKNRFVIVSDKDSAKGLDLPKNVSLYVDIARQDYLNLVKACSFAVVPLQALVKSTGQVVILEAMAYGKPVIATDAVGTRDYIRPGFNGILVPPKDPASLGNAIRQLADDTFLQEKLSQNALDFVKENCTFTAYVSKILDTAHALCRT